MKTSFSKNFSRRTLFCAAALPHTSGTTKNLWPLKGKVQLEINAIRLGIMIKTLDFHRVSDK